MANTQAEWGALAPESPLLKLSTKLADILKEAGHSEMYGVELSAAPDPASNHTPPFTTLLILQKFLRANADDIDKAAAQLLGALQWRKEFQPLKVKNEVFSGECFAGLGFVTELKGVPGSANESDVAVFNIYGAVKDMKRTFGDLDG